MELPHLGQHCNEKSCNKLDFLPMKCDACNEIFCSEHFSYTKHSCPSAHKKDIQVPVCPLCGEPVPTPRGISPDRTVGEHIDQYCKSPETKKIFTNRCMYKNCKKKELIPVKCSQCQINFCLRHRHFADHDCKGAQIGGGSGATSGAKKNALAGNAAEQRRARPNGLNGLFKNEIFTASTTRPPSAPLVIPNTIGPIRSVEGNLLAKNIQGDMTEDEALARAMALSIMELDETADRNRRNRERELNSIHVVNAANVTSNKDKCSLS